MSQLAGAVTMFILLFAAGWALVGGEMDEALFQCFVLIGLSGLYARTKAP